MTNQQNIILIGPMRAGKSTVARLLSDVLGLELVDVDDIRWGYYEEIGYDEDQVKKIMQNGGGYLEMFRYWKPFEAHAVERVLDEYRDCIIDFGAGHTVYENEALFARVKNAFAHFENVFFFLPSQNLDKSVEVLNQRMTMLLKEEVGKVDPDILELNEHFVRHPSNRQLAKYVIYTLDKSAAESCQQILNFIDLP